MTEAQRLARELTAIKRRAGDVIDSDDSDALHKAAAELRRLEAENAALQANLRRSEGLCREWAVKAATWMASPEAAQRLDGYRDMGRQIDTLEAECEQLRADAARYRWMKQWAVRIPPGWALIGWDAAIDAAMKETKLAQQSPAARAEPRACTGARNVQTTPP